MLRDKLTYQYTYQISANDYLQALRTKPNKRLKNIQPTSTLPFITVWLQKNHNLSKCYFLPKLHKTAVPLRPIISACGLATM